MNSDYLFSIIVFSISFFVATHQIHDSDVIKYLAERTIKINEYRGGGGVGWNTIINWVQGVIAGSVTLLFKPTIDQLNKKHIQPFIRRKISVVKKWHDSL